MFVKQTVMDLSIGDNGVKVTKRILSNKPLVEAIFELRWELQELEGGIRTDPHYRILVGSIYDRVKDDYPFHEPLPTTAVPDELAGYVAQHRFRKAENEWPLIQIGPGIITLNDTNGYVWEDFKRRVSHMVDVFLNAYPEPENMRLNRLLLRYIDAIDFNYGNDVFTFLKEKMKTNIALYPELFKDTGVNKLPVGFDLRFSFDSTSPQATAHLRFRRGKREDQDALIWETLVLAPGENLNNTKEGIVEWVNEAHTLTDDWFFKIIDGELLGRFE